MSYSSLPDGALCVAPCTYVCARCTSEGVYQADYTKKFVYPEGVFHTNCYAEMLLETEAIKTVVNALFGSEETTLRRSQSAEVMPLQVPMSDSEDSDFSDAHLAVRTD